MLVNEYTLYVSIQKSSKDAKFGFIWSPFVMSRTDAQIGTRYLPRLDFQEMGSIYDS
jgi:hypothetical protein